MDDSETGEATSIAQITVERDAVAVETPVDPEDGGEEASEFASSDPTAEESEASAETTAPDTSPAEGGSAHTEEQRGAHAMAHFVRVAAAPVAALEAAGLDELIPAISECVTEFDQADTPLSSLHELTLLDAGQVRIFPAGGEEMVELAPRAFPSVSSFAAGVVYTTRDREAEALPSGVPYTVYVDGSDSVPELELTGTAPQELEEVTVGGLPLPQIEALSRSAPVDITWQVGRAEDLVYVDLVTVADGQTRLRCSFSDDKGTGSVPTVALATVPVGEVRVELHRRRTLASTSSSVTDGEVQIEEARLRFDFELSHELLLTE